VQELAGRRGLVEDTIKSTAELVPPSGTPVWRIRGMPQLPGSTAVLGPVSVPGLPEPVRLIVAVRKDGQSAAAGVLVSGYYEQSALGEANALAEGLGLKPAGHWRLTGPFGTPEFYAAETSGAQSWPTFLVSADSDGPAEMCKPVPESDAKTLASHYPELSLRTEPAHREAYVALPNDALPAGPGGNPAVQWQLASEALHAWAEHGIDPESLALKPQDLGVRITYFASEPVTETSAPYCDLAVPFA
jgi:hypothetical protein